jgi:hypothetical protein
VKVAGDGLPGLGSPTGNKSGAFADSSEALDLRGQRVIAEVVAEAAGAENRRTLAAVFRVTVAEMASAIGALCGRVPAAVVAGVISGMPYFEYVAGHSWEVYSGISLSDRCSERELGRRACQKRRM